MTTINLKAGEWGPKVPGTVNSVISQNLGLNPDHPIKICTAPDNTNKHAY